jgi:hypothetical protein
VPYQFEGESESDRAATDDENGGVCHWSGPLRCVASVPNKPVGCVPRIAIDSLQHQRLSIII